MKRDHLALNDSLVSHQGIATQKPARVRPGSTGLVLAGALLALALVSGCASIRSQDDPNLMTYNPNDNHPGGSGWYERP